jgi:hypothetical protein
MSLGLPGLRSLPYRLAVSFIVWRSTLGARAWQGYLPNFPDEETIMFRWLRREPKQLIERRQVLSPALSDYPLYQPPHRQGPNFLRRRQNQAEEEYVSYIHEFVARSDQNVLYFMEQRAARLAALQAFLGKFGVSASLDDAGLASVSAWFPDNGYALANLKGEAVRQTFYQMQTPWDRELRGLNVIFDLGVFLGETLIQKQPRLHWKFTPGSSDQGESFGTGYRVEGFRRKAKGNWMDPGQYIVRCSMNELNDLHSYSPRPSVFRNYDLLVGVVRDYSTR